MQVPVAPSRRSVIRQRLPPERLAAAADPPPGAGHRSRWHRAGCTAPPDRRATRCPPTAPDCRPPPPGSAAHRQPAIEPHRLPHARHGCGWGRHRGRQPPRLMPMPVGIKVSASPHQWPGSTNISMPAAITRWPTTPGCCHANDEPGVSPARIPGSWARSPARRPAPAAPDPRPAAPPARR